MRKKIVISDCPFPDTKWKFIFFKNYIFYLDIIVRKWYFNKQTLTCFKVLIFKALQWSFNIIFMEELLWIQEFQAKQDY